MSKFTWDRWNYDGDGEAFIIRKSLCPDREEVGGKAKDVVWSTGLLRRKGFRLSLLKVVRLVAIHSLVKLRQRFMCHVGNYQTARYAA